MRLGFIGIGYVGLVSGSCLADIGNYVDCFDIDHDKIDALKKNKIPFFEPSLEDVVNNGISNGNLRFYYFSEIDVDQYDALFICVNTPNDTQGNTDLSSVFNVIEHLGNKIKKDCTIFLKSTVPVGTSQKVQEMIDTKLRERKLQNIIVEVASNPEFLKEGDAINDFRKPDRIIVGTESNNVKNMTRSIYAAHSHIDNKLIFMSRESSEMTKYAANSMLATKISFMNDLARLAEKTGANIDSIRAGIGSDSRIGKHFIYAGLGYGGSCLPKDTISFVNQAKIKDVDLPVIEAAIRTNSIQVDFFVNKIEEFFTETGLPKNVAIWGLTFKPNTDDLRSSRAIVLGNKLLNRGYFIKSYDPMFNRIKSDERVKKFNMFDNRNATLIDSNALILATEWREFWHVDCEEIKANGIKVVFDGRNILRKEEILASGMKYVRIGQT